MEGSEGQDRVLGGWSCAEFPILLLDFHSKTFMDALGLKDTGGKQADQGLAQRVY